jgi:hypothetical protein
MALPYKPPQTKGSWLKRIRGYPPCLLRTWLCILAPAALCVYDYLLHPVFFRDYSFEREANLAILCVQRDIRLGTYNSHEIHVSLDSVDTDGYLNYVDSSPTAVVVSCYIADDTTKALRPAQLCNAVRAKLDSVSPEEAHGFWEALEAPDVRTAGQILDVPTRVPREQYAKFRVDRIVVALFSTGDPDTNDLQHALHEATVAASRDKMNNLIIPCLTYKWNDRHSLSFDEYRPAFPQRRRSCGDRSMKSAS